MSNLTMSPIIRVLIISFIHIRDARDHAALLCLNERVDNYSNESNSCLSIR